MKIVFYYLILVLKRYNNLFFNKKEIIIFFKTLNKYFCDGLYPRCDQDYALVI